MLAALQRNKVRVILILGVFLAFFLNAAGLMELRFQLGSGLVFRGNLIEQSLSSGALPAMMRTVDFAMFAAFGALLSLALPVLNPIPASGVTFVCMMIPIWSAYAHPARPGDIPMEYTLLTILILYVVNVLASYFSETQSRQRLVGIFGHYVPPEVVEALMKDPRGYSLEGESREMSVFFSDIKNFSTISEHLDPRQLARMLNTYFTAMTDILHRHGATIDKYIGDAIMAFWGAPLAQPDHAARAVQAAMAMQEGLVRLRALFREQGWPELDIGVGINTGVMNVGNMGSRYRVSYTVVGDAVNLCSRIEHLTRVYHAPILVSESTMKAVPEVLFKEVDHVRVKGKGLPTRIFEPLCRRDYASSTLLENLALHDQALAAYYRQDWDGARSLFQRLHDAGFNAPYCLLLVDRIAALTAAPPIADWGGVTTYG
jgi:adenylate cyclase